MITLSIDDQQEITDLMKMMLSRIDPRGTHLCAANMKHAFELMNDNVQVVFIDVEMAGMNGIEAARRLKARYSKLNIIFVTGHPEYSLAAHSIHPSGFLTKPVCETDLIHELKELRFPLAPAKSPLKVRCNPFALFFNGKPFEFKRNRTIELFAYLIYKNGAFCTNGELLGVLWDGDPNKQGHLRQLVLDLRKNLEDINSEYILCKKYGKIGVDIGTINLEGNPSEIIEEYRWI